VTDIVVTAYNLLTMVQTPNIKDIFFNLIPICRRQRHDWGEHVKVTAKCASHDKEQSVLTYQLAPQGRETLPNNQVPLRILKPSHTVQRFVYIFNNV